MVLDPFLHEHVYDVSAVQLKMERRTWSSLKSCRNVSYKSNENALEPTRFWAPKNLFHHLCLQAIVSGLIYRWLVMLKGKIGIESRT